MFFVVVVQLPEFEVGVYLAARANRMQARSGPLVPTFSPYRLAYATSTRGVIEVVPTSLWKMSPQLFFFFSRPRGRPLPPSLRLIYHARFPSFTVPLAFLMPALHLETKKIGPRGAYSNSPTYSFTRLWFRLSKLFRVRRHHHLARRLCTSSNRDYVPRL